MYENKLKGNISERVRDADQETTQRKFCANETTGQIRLQQQQHCLSELQWFHRINTITYTPAHRILNTQKDNSNCKEDMGTEINDLFAHRWIELLWVPWVLAYGDGLERLLSTPLDLLHQTETVFGCLHTRRQLNPATFRGIQKCGPLCAC